MARSNLEIVFDHLHDRAAGDVESLAATFDPGVVHQGVTDVVHEGETLELVCTGRDAVLERMRRADARGADRGLERVELIAAGDRVVVGFADPRFLEVPWLTGGQLYIVFTLREGRIVRMDDHRTRAEALAAAGSPAADWM